MTDLLEMLNAQGGSDLATTECAFYSMAVQNRYGTD